MKYKKYILFLLLMIILGNNKIYAANADKCYYVGDGLKATFDFDTDKDYQDVYVDMVGKKADHDSEDMLNWRGGFMMGTRPNTTVAGHKFDDLYSNKNDAKNNGTCPNYVVIQYCPGFLKDAYRVWGTNDLNEASSAAAGISAKDGCTGNYASFKNSDGSKRTAEDYYATFITPNAGGTPIDLTDPVKACDALFGDVKDAGTKDSDGNTIEPPSVAYMINSVLQYVRIIVPILIILLGVLDFAKAVVAGKEDEMKKAQSTFIKRLIAGVAVFFVPVIVNLVMQLADVVWDGMGLSHCNLP